MRVVFAGTPDVAVPSLRALLDSQHEVAAVITRPDARRGRGRKGGSSPVRVVADELGIEVLTPEKPSDPAFIAKLRKLAPDAAPVVAYGGLIPRAALEVPKHGWVNLHFSLLPAWRGAAPVQHAIMAGDDVTGATTFLLEEGLDTGPVLGTMTQAITGTDTAGDVLGSLATAGAGLLVSTLDALQDGTLTPVPQPAHGVSLAPKITVEECEITWGFPAHVVDRRIRGASPAPGAWTTFRGERLKVLRSRTLPAQPQISQEDDGSARHAAAPTASVNPGTVTATKKQVSVRCASGDVELLEVQPQGKKAMNAADWARGVRINDNEVLGDQ